MRKLALASVLVFVGLAAQTAAAQTVKLSATAGAADDELGHAVAIDGNTAIVGAPGDDAQATDAGSASVFSYNGTAWVRQQKLLPSGNAADGFFGSSVAIVGNVAVVGAYGDANAGGFAGAAYVFKRTGNTWALSQKLVATDAAANKFFGTSVAMTTDTVAIGASGDATQGSSGGAIYVFTLGATGFAQHQKLLASDGAANNNLGGSVAISGATVLAGATGDVDDGSGAGGAYVFVKNGAGSFAQQQKLVATTGSLNDYFGGAVALSGNTALIGAFSDDTQGVDAGAAYVFVRSGATWAQSQKLVAADGAAGDFFGFSVDLDGNDAVIGATNDDDNGSGSGSAYTYSSTGTFTQRAKLHATGAAASDFFGYAVATNAAKVLVGANGKQDFGSNSGAAFLFSQAVTSVPAIGSFVLVLALALSFLGMRRRGSSKLLFGALAVFALGCETSSSTSPAADGKLAQAPASAAQALNNTITLTATRDTTVRASQPDAASGAVSVLDLNRTLVDFDVNAMRAAVGAHDYLTSAQLELKLVTNLLRRSPRGAAAYLLTQAWTEAGATWDCAIDADIANGQADCSGASQWSMTVPPNPWAVPGSPGTIPASLSGAARLDVSNDVRSLVAGQSAFGWLISGSAAGERNEFASRESTTPPQLIMTVRHCDPVLCDDADPCTVDSCDATALCVHSAAIDGTSCNDGNACTQTDSCLAGLCTGGSPVTCSATDPCHAAGVCVPGTGVCSNPAAADGVACNDGNACTQTDSCNAGVCNGNNAVACNAGDACHPGMCNPSDGSCSYASACALYGVGSLSPTLTDGLVVSPQTLEDGLSNNLVGGLGSAITYTGVGNLYIATPDRGPNNGLDSYSNRFYEIELTLAGGTVTPRVVGGDTLEREDSTVFSGIASAFDVTGSSNSLRLDPEGVRVSPTGTFYVSDEYGPYLYEFGADGKRLRALTLPSKFSIAHPADATHSELPPVNTAGRQTNRGMEGLAITPDGTKLFGMMQNALLQDGALNGSNSRVGLNNRLVEIDTATGATRELVYQLSDKSYGINEILAVNDHQFLAIERDGNAGNAAGFKQLFLFDTTGATDVSGTASLPTGALPVGITPVAKTPFINLLAPEYGLAGATFPEKIEGLAFGPDQPNGNHTLVVTNDNDFLGAAGNPDNFYVFSVSPSVLPGFVAQQSTFSSACSSVTCAAADQCHSAGTCDPASGTCGNPARPNGTSCNDGNPSTTSDVCTNGTCSGVDLCATVTCTAADQCHVAGTCDSQTGTCSNPGAADGTFCSDGNANTVGDLCEGGICLGTDLCMNVTCSASDQCHVAGSCDYQTGACSNPAAADGTTCNDANANTVGDACVGGACQGTNLCANVTCTASDQCHVAGTCDYQTGSCSNPAASNGTSCNDGNVNTVSDVCTGGGCAGTDLCANVTCTASDQCHTVGTCDHQTGTCSAPAKSNGSACNDSNPCTSSDVCTAGSCAGAAVVCAAGSDACHPGVCNPSNGSCSNTVNQCSLYGVGSLSSSLTDALVVSPQTLQDGTSNNQVGALGSAITYTGVGNLYLATPDRGPNAGLDSFTDRYYELEISLSGGTVTPRIVGGDTLKRGDGTPFKGFSASFDATGSTNSLRLDPEGVRVSPTGTFYISDEYGPYLYEFANDGTRLRALSVPSKFLIANANADSDTEIANNSSGRQGNRGMEGLAITPDGSKLYGIMQNALLQDHAVSGTSRIGKNNRILEINTSSGATRELLYQLDSQSYGINELLAVNDHQFITIERDGNAGSSAAFKKLCLIDITGATDISGIASLPQTGTPGGVTPVTKTVLLDLLSASYGLAGSSFPEKVEGLAFGPDLPDGRHVLIVTNDNDFISGQSDNFYVFAIGAPALPAFVAPQATFSSTCQSVTCTPAGVCYSTGTCAPATGTCSMPPLASGTVTSSQTTGDCKTQQCNGSGGTVQVINNSDTPNDGNQCTGDSCVSGTPTYTNSTSGSTCSQNGGNVCDGAGGCVSCLAASDCPVPGNECITRTCNAGTCGTTNVANGTPTASGQTAGDCNQLQCNGVGAIVSRVDDADVPNDSNLCTNDICTAGVPTNPPTGAGSSCGGSNVCDGSGHCTGCSTASDCAGTDTTCATRTCTVGSCGWSYAAAGTFISDPTPGDCKRNECDGAGNSVVNNFGGDLPNDNNQCTSDSCSLGSPVYTNQTYGTACTQSGGQICNGSGSCIAAPIVISEVESNSDPLGDWIELYNSGTGSVNIGGYLLGDSTSATLTIPANTILAAGGYVAFVVDGTSGGLPNAFGLGPVDSARVLSPTGVLLDSFSWTSSAVTTNARCPTPTGAFTTSGYPTKGAANGCSMPNIKVNEAESNGDPNGDWIELVNLGSTSVNIGGFLLGDNSTARLIIPNGTTIAAGGYVSFVTDGTTGGLPNAFGLGSADDARFFHPDGTTLIDSTSWTAHAPVTWGRFPNGTGAFGNRSTSTRGAANVP